MKRSALPKFHLDAEKPSATRRNLSCLFVFLLLKGTIANAAPLVQREVLVDSRASKKIELVWSKPDGTGPWPTLLFVHPHQEWPNKIGAEIFLKNKTIEYWVSKGFVTAAVSQPGYGKSDGPADFCGPESQAAVIESIRFLQKQPSVKRSAVFLYGGSRGATVAGIVAAKEPHMAGVILKSGLYDFVDAYQMYPWYSAIKLSMIWEIGWNQVEALRERSLLSYADHFKVPALIIHGSSDDRASIDYASSFVQKVNAAGGNAEFLSLESEHIIPMEKVKAHMDDFLKKHLSSAGVP